MKKTLIALAAIAAFTAFAADAPATKVIVPVTPTVVSTPVIVKADTAKPTKVIKAKKVKAKVVKPAKSKTDTVVAPTVPAK